MRQTEENNQALLNLFLGHGPEQISFSLGNMNELFDIFLDTEYADDTELRQKMLNSVHVIRNLKNVIDTTPVKTIEKLKRKISKTFQNA